MPGEKKRAAKPQKRLTAPAKVNVFFFKCDVSDPEQIKALINFTVAEFGGIYCLINNCGISAGAQGL